MVTTEGVAAVGAYVLVNPNSFAASIQDGTGKAYLEATKEQLQNAPKYT